jgi:hypothetical protein
MQQEVAFELTSEHIIVSSIFINLRMELNSIQRCACV